MKWRTMIAFAATLIFILVVSYKILEPDIQNRYLYDYDSRENEIVLARDIGREEHEVTLFWGNQTKEQVINQLIEKYDLDWNLRLHESPWKLAESWVKPREIHPEIAPEIGAILHAVATKKIVAADVGYKGTQLKLALILAGGQRVAFKPQWFERDHVIKGKPYAGADRHNGEIAAFHLNRILGFRRAPLVVGRVVDLEQEIKPVAEERLLETFFKKGNNTCFYGKCYYCKSEADGVCAKGAKLEGAVVLWLPSSFTFRLWRHPWGRTYKKGKQAKWETDGDGYCDAVERIPPYDAGPRLLDILDACVFDYLIGNADRHHYETVKGYDDSMLVMMDSAKSFGNPYHDERSILAPLYQCCRLRMKTWIILQKLKDNVLSTVMKKILSKEPIAPILTQEHYIAMDRRLIQIFNEVEICIKKNGADSVLVQEHTGPIPFET